MSQPQPIAPQPEAATNGESQPTTPPVAASGQYEACAECGAPLERQQRYCVNCGARRADAANPASRYLAVATRRRQTTTTATRTRPPQGSGTRVAAVAFFALLPLAVAIGVLVGRSGGTDNSDLLNALRSQPATAATGSGTNVSDTSSKLLPSDFSLDKGYTVKLDLLPIESTDQGAASRAEADAKGKGAGDVGIINPGDFTTTPDQGQKDYVLYSGEYKDKADAQKALGKLKKAYPDAEVIAVASASANSNSPSGTKVVAHTSHGDIHQVAGLNPSQKQIQQGTQKVNQIAHQTGKSYIQQQRSLPDVVSIGGDGSSPPPLPTGNGD
jgi:hypothetical protein